MLGVAWYRFRVTFGRRWRGYLALALLVGLVGGVSLGSIAAARRTRSSFPVFLAHTNPSDLSVSFYGVNSAGSSGDSIRVADQIARLPQVRTFKRWISLPAARLGPDGAPLNLDARVDPVGSVDGLYFSFD